MNHFTSILICQKKIPKSFIDATRASFSSKINVLTFSNEAEFIKYRDDAHLLICNSLYYSKILQIEPCGKLIYVKEKEYNNTINSKEIIFDPYRNDDRTKIDYNECIDTFLKTVEDALETFHVPFSYDPSYCPIVVFD